MAKAIGPGRKRGAKVRKTPQWSAVRRGRPIVRLVACFQRSRHPGCALRRSAPSFGSEDALRAFARGERKNRSFEERKPKVRTELAGESPARMTALVCAPGCLTI